MYGLPRRQQDRHAALDPGQQRRRSLVDVEFRADQSSIFLAADLDGTPAASRALAEQATRVLGGHIDILVNNAGIYPAATTTLTDEATFDRVYAVNVKAPFFLTAVIAPAMAEAGGGAVINLGSWIARLGIPGSSVYSSTKGAMETLTRSWAAEFGPRGVRVNAISPGVVRTPDPAETTPYPGDVMMHGTFAALSLLPRTSRDKDIERQSRNDLDSLALRPL